MGRIEDEIKEMFNEYGECDSTPIVYMSDEAFEFWVYRILNNRVGGKKPAAE